MRLIRILRAAFAGWRAHRKYKRQVRRYAAQKGSKMANGTYQRAVSAQKSKQISRKKAASTAVDTTGATAAGAGMAYTVMAILRSLLGDRVPWSPAEDTAVITVTTAVLIPVGTSIIRYIRDRINHQ